MFLIVRILGLTYCRANLRTFNPEANMNHTEIEPGLTCHSYKTGKFKTNVIVILIRCALSREAAANNSLLAEMLHTGGRQTKRELLSLCESLSGAAFEIGAVKKGEEHIIRLYLEVLNDKYAGKKLLVAAGELLRGLLFSPPDSGFEPQYFDIQKELLIQKIKSKINDKKKYALDRCIELMCEDEAFSVPQEGFLEDAAAVSLSGLQEYYLRVINNPIEVGLIGDINEDAAIEWVKAYFSRADTTAFRRIQLSEAYVKPVKRRIRSITEEMNLTQCKLVVGLRLAPGNFYSNLMLNEILAGGTFSKLFQILREKRSLCYYVHSFIFRAKSIMMIQAGIDAADFDTTFDVMKAQTDNITNGHISDYELNCARDSLLSHFKMIEDSPQSLMDYYMSNYLSGDFISVPDAALKIKEVTAENISKCAAEISFDTVYMLK
jgi:predicted Zn-dependent peptidase